MPRRTSKRLPDCSGKRVFNQPKGGEDLAGSPPLPFPASLTLHRIPAADATCFGAKSGSVQQQVFRHFNGETEAMSDLVSGMNSRNTAALETPRLAWTSCCFGSRLSRNRRARGRSADESVRAGPTASLPAARFRSAAWSWAGSRLCPHRRIPVPVES